MTTPDIIYPRVVPHADWLKARLDLLTKEKELTAARDRLNTRRRELPMVRLDKPYQFEGPAGPIGLPDLFAGSNQLIVYHFMWLWEKGQPLDEGCRSCSGWVDELGRGLRQSLRARGTTFVLVSRAPLAKLTPFKTRMGWTIPWYSSFGSDFNHDFGVTLDQSIAPLAYNYRSKAEHEKAGTGYYFGNPDQPYDLPGTSCFLRKGDEVFHTYSTYGRGAEALGGGYAFLDLTALGRQEDWEEPNGRKTGLGAMAGSPEIKYPDQYET